MDLITGLLKIVKKHDLIMLIVERLKNVAHFILVKSTFSTRDVA